MRTFFIIWAGQLLSLLSTSMTGFGLTIWAWQQTQRATALALVGVANFAPMIIFSPIAGALVDRWNRKLVMMLSDIAAGCTTIAILVLLSMGQLQIWHLYILGAISGTFQAFHFPAYSAAITMIVPKAQYGRAAGMMSLAQSGSSILAPALAAAMLGVTGLRGILLLDVATLILAISILLLLRIPQPDTSEAGRASRGTLLHESAFGFRYILARPSLLGLQLVFFTLNLVASFGGTVSAPMILARSGNNELVLGSTQSIAGIGGVLGGVLLSAWGGPKRRVRGILLGLVAMGLLGQVLLGVGRGVVIWAAASFFIQAIAPIVNGSSQAIWQSKVPPDIQGRVFSVRLLIAQITAPLAMLLAGPLADRVFEPAMHVDGALARTFAPLVGSGPGAGMALMIVGAGLLSAVVGVGGFFFPAVRNAETLIPDHDVGSSEP